MRGASASLGLGRIVATKQDVIWLPRDGVRGRRGVVMIGGQAQTGEEWLSNSSPSQRALARALAERFPMVSVDVSSTWGNDAGIGRIDSARTFLGTLGCATDQIVLVGASMGAVVALNYARANPTRVAGLVAIMPAADVGGIRDGNIAGARDNINTAWGLPLGSTSATDALPALASPLANLPAIRAAVEGDVAVYHSSVDAIALPASALALCEGLGVTPRVISNTNGHVDALFGDVPDLTAFIAARL